MYRIDIIYLSFVLLNYFDIQVVELIHRKPSVRRISFVAHSVGGLVARYAIGKLYRPPMKENGDMSSSECEEERRGTIYGLEALNFITFATPHLGSRGSKQVSDFSMFSNSISIKSIP